MLKQDSRPALTLSRVVALAMAVTAITVGTAQISAAKTYKILYTFQSNSDGAGPSSNLLEDGSGGFYGTTWTGGGGGANCFGYGCGTVYHLTPPATQGGAWTETILYSFLGTPDAGYPTGNLVKDSAGNLYGSTNGGGPANTGTVFELSPPAQAGGAWTETVLHSFTYGTSDGSSPNGGLVWGPSGSLYGETAYGGYYGNVFCQIEGCGTVFQLSPPAQSGGAWTESIIYNWLQGGCCGRYMNLTSKGGSLFGATFQLGTYSNGSVVELNPPTSQSGLWSERDLYSFSLQDVNLNGEWPSAGVAFDNAGNLYGTVNNGGTIGGGTVYELQRPAKKYGAWTFALLHNFTGAPNDGSNSQTPLVMDTKGNFYGASYGGGYETGQNCRVVGCGVIFELSNTAGTWSETVLHEFKAGTDGSTPETPVTVRNGIVYGTTFSGGTAASGVVFEIIP